MEHGLLKKTRDYLVTKKEKWKGGGQKKYMFIGTCNFIFRKMPLGNLQKLKDKYISYSKFFFEEIFLQCSLNLWQKNQNSKKYDLPKKWCNFFVFFLLLFLKKSTWEILTHWRTLTSQIHKTSKLNFYHVSPWLYISFDFNLRHVSPTTLARTKKRILFSKKPKMQRIFNVVETPTS